MDTGVKNCIINPSWPYDGVTWPRTQELPWAPQPWSTTTINLGVLPMLSISKAENGWKVSYNAKEYVFESRDSLMKFIQDSLFPEDSK